MAKLTTYGDFERELAEIDGMLELDRELTEAHGADPAAEFMMAGLRQRRQELAAELEQRGDEGMVGHELNVTFAGDPVEGHSIEADFAAKMLDDLQEMVRAVAAEQTTGLGRSGPVQRVVQQRATLMLTGTYDGSFGMRLETRDVDLDLFGEQVSPVFHAIKGVISLVDAGSEGTRVLEAVAPLGRRALNKYVAFLDNLAARNASVSIAWPTSEGVRRASLGPREAQRSSERLSRVDVVTNTLHVEGRLDEAGIRRGSFELILAGGEVIAGKVGEGVTSNLQEFFNRPCRALLTVSVAIDRVTGDQRRSYRLDKLAPPGEDFFPE